MTKQVLLLSLPAGCLFLVHHALVKGEFLALQDVSIATAGLSRSRGYLGQHASGTELSVECRVQSAVRLPSLELLGDLGGLGGEVHALSGDVSLLVVLLAVLRTTDLI